MTSLQAFRPAVLALSLFAPGDFGLAERESKPVRARKMRFSATAYTIEGTTASGEQTKAGRTVAADPDILPLGSRILITGAGKYPGQYVVADTGKKVQGRKLDIYMPLQADAKRFGVRTVWVQILSRGEPPK